MKRYIKSSTTSGLVGIWWIYKNTVIADYKSLDDGYNDGNYVQYDETNNHSTEWRRLISEYVPDNAEEMIKKGYKSLERGRVVFNLRTQCYEITCSQNVRDNINQCKMIVKAFDLTNCRFDFVVVDHYHIAELTGNPALDWFEYGS